MPMMYWRKQPAAAPAKPLHVVLEPELAIFVEEGLSARPMAGAVAMPVGIALISEF